MLPHNYTVHEHVFHVVLFFLNIVVTLKYKLILTCVTKSTMHALRIIIINGQKICFK